MLRPMSHMTQTVHARGVSRSRLLAAVDGRMVTWEVSVSTIGAAAGMSAPLLDPHDRRNGDEKLLYLR